MANLFDASFYGWRPVRGLSKVSVRQKFGNHTLFFLDYNIEENQQFLLPPENTPFTVRFGSGPLDQRTAYGYVNHLEEQVGDDGSKFTRIVGVGTSKVMNTVTPRSWVGLSRTGIIREIGAGHRFRTVVHSHPEVLGTWASGAQSDFRAVNYLAEEIGFRLWVDGPTLWLLDPHLVLASASTASTKVIRQGQQGRSQVFKGSNVPGQVKASKRFVQYGVNRTTNEVLTSTSGALGMPVEILSSPASSYGEAQFAASGAQKAAQDQAVVEAVIKGDSSITPGTPVRFDRSTSTPDQLGVWLVNEATHEIANSGGFTTTLSASRDRDYPLTSRTLDVVSREGKRARAVIRNGATWESDTQERISA